MLLFHIKRIISSEKWFNYVVTSSSSFFFFENAKNLGRSDDAKRRKNKEDGPNKQKYATIHHWRIKTYRDFDNVKIVFFYREMVYYTQIAQEESYVRKRI